MRRACMYAHLVGEVPGDRRQQLVLGASQAAPLNLVVLSVPLQRGHLHGCVREPEGAA